MLMKSPIEAKQGSLTLLWRIAITASLVALLVNAVVTEKRIDEVNRALDAMRSPPVADADHGNIDWSGGIASIQAELSKVRSQIAVNNECIQALDQQVAINGRAMIVMNRCVKELGAAELRRMGYTGEEAISFGDGGVENMSK